MTTLMNATADAACSCPSCNSVLRVSLAAAGRKARCRCCGHAFRVPPRSVLIDDTASYLIHRDVVREFESRDHGSDGPLPHAA